MLTYNHLRFGIETEVLLTPRDAESFADYLEVYEPAPQNNGDKLKAFAEYLLDDYETHIGFNEFTWPNMENKIGVVFKEYDTKKWTLGEDPTINRDLGDRQFGIEVITPILHFNERRFRDYVRGVWDRLDALCLIDTSNFCGTHVHVSPNNGFNVRQLKAVARAVLYFEPAINALVPPHRRGNKNCMSFFASNENFKGKTPKAAIDEVDKIEELIAEEIDNPQEINESYHGEDHPITQLMNPGSDRYFTWNFVTLNRTLTVEFRQGPGVTTPGEALAWAEFVVTFIHAAVKDAHSYEYLEQFTINVNGLKQFLKGGIVPGVSDESILAQIIGRAGGLSAIPGPGEPPKEEQLISEVKRKKQDPFEEVKKGGGNVVCFAILAKL